MNIVDAAETVLINHQRHGIKGCSCGKWGSDYGHLGQSHVMHIIDELHRAGIILTRYGANDAH